MLSEQLKFIYIHIPKTAGKTIDKYFWRQGFVSMKKWHATAFDWRQELGENRFAGYFRFATVRNPWDRLVSEYFWQQRMAEKKGKWGNPTISFSDFCRSDCKWYPANQIAYGHLADQSHFIFDDRDHLLVDELIRFECFEKDFRTVCRRIGMEVPILPRLNKTEHESYWHYYTDDLVDFVAQRFERDIRLLGYAYRDGP